SQSQCEEAYGVFVASAGAAGAVVVSVAAGAAASVAAPAASAGGVVASAGAADSVAAGASSHAGGVGPQAAPRKGRMAAPPAARPNFNLVIGITPRPSVELSQRVARTLDGD